MDPRVSMYNVGTRAHKEHLVEVERRSVSLLKSQRLSKCARIFNRLAPKELIDCSYFPVEKAGGRNLFFDGRIERGNLLYTFCTIHRQLRHLRFAQAPRLFVWSGPD